MIEGTCKISGCPQKASKSIALFAYHDLSQCQYVTSFVCKKCFDAILVYWKKKGEEK